MAEHEWAISILRQLDEFIPDGVAPEIYGQEEAKQQILPFLAPHVSTPNILFLGEPGIGKTALAKWVATNARVPFQASLCPVEVWTAPDHGIWLVDECHRQTRPEPLFGIMERNDVTVIGATTRPDRLEPAFRSRFFLQIQLKPLDNHARKELMADLVPDLDENSLDILAHASAGNPRQAHRIAATARALQSTDAEEILAICRINADGLNELHMNILKTLSKRPRPIGLSTLALMVRSDESTVADHELLLLDFGLLELSKSGRTLTRRGLQYAYAL